jgi:hypothetical protein
VERFKELKSFAGVLQPGDSTRYELVVVEQWDCYEVVVLNDAFFDKLTFLRPSLEFYTSIRGEETNPWTIKAAKEMLERWYLLAQSIKVEWED